MTEDETNLAEDDPIYLELVRQRDATLTLYEREITDLRTENERAALESEALIAYLRGEVDRLRASFDAHHEPNSQEGYRCNVCGEDHPYVDPRAIPILIEDLCDIDD